MAACCLESADFGLRATTRRAGSATCGRGLTTTGFGSARLRSGFDRACVGFDACMVGFGQNWVGLRHLRSTTLLVGFEHSRDLPTLDLRLCLIRLGFGQFSGRLAHLRASTSRTGTTSFWLGIGLGSATYGKLSDSDGIWGCLTKFAPIVTKIGLCADSLWLCWIASGGDATCEKHA